MRPPDVAAALDDSNIVAQAELIAYDQVRAHEEHELMVAQIKARSPL